MALRPSVRASSLRALTSGLALAAFTACRAGEPEQVVVAEVGDQKITVEDVARYMAGAGYGVNVEDARKAVDQLIDVHLVRLRARERRSVSPRESLQIKEWRDILLANQFREDVIWREIEIDEKKLREWYDENVGEEALVRHILIGVAPTATAAERRTARQEAESVLRQLRSGAEFADLAGQHSDDPASKDNGGLMRWFRKGEMVEPFEKAAFEGEVGALYPAIVETQFGFHILRIENRRKPSYEDLRDEIEEQLAMPQRSEAESAYVTRLMETSGVEFHEANIDRFIALLDAQTGSADDPPRQPTAEERQLVLATFRAGEVKLGEIYDLYQNLPPNNQRAIEALDQTQMVQALAMLVQQRLLLAEAKAKKIALDTTRQRQFEERVDQMYIEAYLREVGNSQLEVSDDAVRRYYDEHREFYRDRSYDEVSEQIRRVLLNQRMDALGDAESQQRLIAAVADSQAERVEVVRHEGRYDEILHRLREKYEEQGRDPGAVEAARPRAQGEPPSGAAGR